MNNINNGEAFGGNVNIFNKEDWLSDDTKISINERAFLCLSHFINHMNLGDNLKILEVGPLPISDIGYDYNNAPISLFSNQLPKNNYLGVGGHKKDNELIEKFMGDVPFIAGMIDSRYPEMGINEVLKYFDGAPNIVYGRHVFENSSSGEGTFPLGRSFMLDGTAQVLEDGGYLIIDNAFGDYSCVLRGSETYSKHLGLVSVYYYEENQGIFIYKKSNK